MSRFLRRQLADARSIAETTELEINVVYWLYQLVRRNIKRGRAFELDDVITSGRADCLGYAKLLSAIAPLFGMTLGIVEVVIDNAGRFVPHHANLLKLSDGTYRFIDLWYGSKDIHHRRIGALVEGSPRDIKPRGAECNQRPAGTAR